MTVLNEGTSKYPSDGRGKYEKLMEAVGYVEDPKYKDMDTGNAYCCGSCEYFKPSMTSVTGYQCSRWLFPDRQYGCCDFWQKKGSE